MGVRREYVVVEYRRRRFWQRRQAGGGLVPVRLPWIEQYEAQRFVVGATLVVETSVVLP